MSSLVGCVIALSNFLNAQKPQTGVAVHYQTIGLFAQVARNRGIVMRDDVMGYAAVRSCAHIGDLVYARVGRTVGWLQVLDCAAPGDYRYQDSITYGHLRGVVIEVNASFAREHGWHWNGRTGGKTSATVYGYRRVR